MCGTLSGTIHSGATVRYVLGSTILITPTDCMFSRHLVSHVKQRKEIGVLVAPSQHFFCFFCSNALIAFARSLCKCLLAVLITVREANRSKLRVFVVPKPYDVIPH